MFYVNVYQHRELQFLGLGHTDRREADDAARSELAVERLTRRVGLLRVKLKTAPSQPTASRS